MENMQLVSVRIEAETVRKLEDIALRNRPYRRSDIIRILLKVITTNIDYGTMVHIIHNWHKYTTSGIKIKLEKKDL